MLPTDKDLKLEITELHVFKKVEGKHKHKESEGVKHKQTELLEMKNILRDQMTTLGHSFQSKGWSSWLLKQPPNQPISPEPLP